MRSTSLRGVQNGDGGFGQFDGRSSNAQSTAYAVQGLVAAGRSPGRFGKSGRSPIAYLRARQNADGSVDYSSTAAQTPVWVTAQAVMALKRKPLPLDPIARERVQSASAAAGAKPAADEPAAEAPAAKKDKKKGREEQPAASERGALRPDIRLDALRAAERSVGRATRGHRRAATRIRPGSGSR